MSCKKTQVKLCGKEDCQICFERSFASHEKSQYILNPNPSAIRKGSCEYYDFKCDKCNHQFKKRIKDITGLKQWCPYCGNQILCDKEDCQICLEKSFKPVLDKLPYELISHNYSRQLFRGGRTKIELHCNTCNHNFPTTCKNISQNRGCPYCATNSSALCDKEDCDHCFQKSFAAHPKSKYLLNANPRKILRGSVKKYNFKCEEGHLFNSNPNIITTYVKPQWCPKCVNKTEKKFLEYLDKEGYNYEYQFSPEWLRNPETNRFLPMDFCLLDLKIIIELDGRQHFQKVMDWPDPDEIHKRDVWKMEQAKDNGYRVIRVLQETILYKNYWKSFMKSAIEGADDFVYEENDFYRNFIYK